MVLKGTFNNISFLLWLLVLLVEETGVLGEVQPTRRNALKNFIT
jgi:hypothetical protein